MQVKVSNKIEVATDICAFELMPLAGGVLPAFSAGAHIDVHIADNLVRQYSLYNSPDDRSRYCIGVLRDPNSRGGSQAMHQLNEGSLLEISQPKNHFPLVAEAKHAILIAGGIGVTPLLCMAEQLASAGAGFELHYCTRSPEHTAFRQRFAQTDLLEHVRCYFDSNRDDRVDFSSILARPNADTHVYVCGPAGFITAVLNAAKMAGWSDSHLHREYFTASPEDSGQESGVFQVQIASTGQLIKVEADQTVAEALNASGIEIPLSCEQGVCGTCLTGVLSGIPEHRDVYLTAEEQQANDQFLPCCSRAKTPLLVLDR